jgi:HSP20 family molecular chaperone IbpA
VIEMAVAGFGKQDIELVLEDGVLTIKGSVTTDDAQDYIFKGIQIVRSLAILLLLTQLK